MFNINRFFLFLIIFITSGVVTLRATSAVRNLINGDETAFLAFPLTVILPGLAFGFFAQQKNLSSQESVLMQVGVMIQLLLILALPGFALYLALGFPVVFLVVELFERKMNPRVCKAIKHWVIT